MICACRQTGVRIKCGDDYGIRISNPCRIRTIERRGVSGAQVYGIRLTDGFLISLKKMLKATSIAKSHIGRGYSAASRSLQLERPATEHPSCFTLDRNIERKIPTKNGRRRIDVRQNLMPPGMRTIVKAVRRFVRMLTVHLQGK